MTSTSRTCTSMAFTRHRRSKRSVHGRRVRAFGRYFGDHVLHHVEPGKTAEYRFDIDEDETHHAGTNWYHPHIHGSTAIQMVNGAAGALIIEGDIDQAPGVGGAKERVMVMNQVPFDSKHTTPLRDGEACTEDTLSVNNFASTEEEAKPRLLNGKFKPRILSPMNQVERWRMVYSGSPAEMG